MKKVWLSAGALVALMSSPGAITAPAAPQVMAVKTFSPEMIMTMMDTAVKCANNPKATVVIVDRNQETIASYRGPWGTLSSVEVSRRKAATSTQFGRPSADVASPPAPQPGQPAKAPPSDTDRLLTYMTRTAGGSLVLGGAQPIMIGNEILGGIGLSGPGTAEDKCALEAIAAVKDFLK